MFYKDMVAGMFSRAKGLPRAEAADAMRDTCIDFCKRTYALVTGAEVAINGTEVPAIDFVGMVLDIVEARIPGKSVLVTYINDPRADDIEAGNDPDYDYAITYAEPNNAQLVPAATEDAPVTVEFLLAVAPGPESTEVDDFIWQRYSDGLKHGALYRVLEEPGRPWSNPSSAAYHKTEYERAVRAGESFASKNRRVVAQELRVETAEPALGRVRSRTF